MTVLLLAASALSWIRWAGVIYLILLGIHTWRESTVSTDGAAEVSNVVTFSRGLVLAVVNPKTLVFNAAFLPQFVGSAEAASQQIYLLAAVYLTVVAVGDACWALFASSARRWLAKVGKWHNRLTGGVLVGAGVGLALANK